MKYVLHMIALIACVGVAHAEEVTLDKGGFKLTYDCSNRTALRYEYSLSQDTGSAARPSSFYTDPDLPAGCLQQTSTASYASVKSGYDRGHLVTSNHMDATSTYIKRANYMTNIAPQIATFNQGIWVQAENVAECYRDIAPLTVYGGVVYSDTSNDYFLSSHGIRTPEYFWKTIITSDPATGAKKAISWYIPNREGLSALNSYIVSIAELETILGASRVGITASASVKAQKPTSTWPLPSACNLS